MSTRSKRLGWILLVIVGGWVIYTAGQGPFAIKRSLPGHVVRFVFGSSGAEQAVDDLADELSVPTNAAALRTWAGEVMAAERNRQVPAEQRLAQGFLPHVPAREVQPPQVLAGFRWMNVAPAEVALQVDEAGRVVGVILGWANLRQGIVVQPGGHAPALEGTFHQRQVAPDILVFSLES